MKIASFSRCCLGWLLLGCAVNLSAGELRGGSDTLADPELVKLDPFIVNGIKPDLPWRHARAGDYEVLTLCSTNLTAKVLEALHRGTVMLPPAFRVLRSEPVTVILFDDQAVNTQPRLKATRKVASSNVRYGPNYWLVWSLPGPETISDREALVYAARIPAGSDWATIDFDHAQHSFAELAPASAPWLQEALFGEFGLYVEAATYVRQEAVHLPSMPRLMVEGTAKTGINTDSLPPLIPLAEFFSGPVPDQAASPAAFQRWQSQSLLIVRWALTAEKKRPFSAEAFWRFAYEAGQSRASENLFQECFHRSYGEASAELQLYFRDAVFKPADISLPGLHSPTPLRALKLRPATEGEIARLKGNFERMEANRLKADHPLLAQQYEGEARRTLKRGLKATDHDPQLRGILGLLEFDAGNLLEARPHLEAAAAAGQAGTHALIALAKLRFDEERARLPVDAKLAAAALERVLTPLFAARERRPSVVDLYQLIAEAWGLSATPPTRGNLSVLIEGTEFFPQDPTLLLSTAKLHARNGFTAETVVLAEHGMKISGDPAAKARFAEIISTGSPGP